MRRVLLAAAFALAVNGQGADPIVRSWIVNPTAAGANRALRVVLPNVHGVRVEGRHVYVESAGLSLQSLGPLEANDREPPMGPRHFVFRLPLEAKPGTGAGVRTPLAIVGVFLNGVPFYTPVSAVSYRDQNFWHRDSVASWDGGVFTATGRPSSDPLPGPGSPLLASLLQPNNRHSPLIGFALDGFPVYGPYGWDQNGKVQRLRSSYSIRSTTRRTKLPDGTELTASQDGPPVNAEFPLGSFVEDYEYVAGSGDLDEHNGRFARTPEYPLGTYAYYLSTDAQSKMTYPYLVGGSYFGQIANSELSNAAHADLAPAFAPDTVKYRPLDKRDERRVELTAPVDLNAGELAELALSIRDSQGRKIRFLEKVHEQPIHLMIVSSDLAEFAHIHPELQPDDTYTVTYCFPHGGTYWLYADHTPPGGSRTISRFQITVKGVSRPAETLHPEVSSNPARTQDGLRVTLSMPAPLRAGKDLTFRFGAWDAATGQPVDDLEPYLGAWAHITIVSQDRQEFIHAHPSDGSATITDTNFWQHTHAIPGPSPSTVSTVTGFRRPGIYRLWAQFQREGRVIAFPFTINVAPAEVREVKKQQTATPIPAGAIRIRVSSGGFEPSRITAPAGRPVKLAFERRDAQNCVNTVVFPDLGIRKPLPAGETVIVELPASAPGELHFACGMNMYRGSLALTPRPAP